MVELYRGQVLTTVAWCMAIVSKRCLTSTETIRLIRDGEKWQGRMEVMMMMVM